MILSLILLPVLVGVISFLIRPGWALRIILPATAAAHAALTAWTWWKPPAPALDGWMLLDAPGQLFLSIISILFLFVSIYAVGYLMRENWGQRQDFEEGMLFTNARESVFVCCLLLFLGMMTLVTVSQHFGLLWVAVEATTLASAPLIYFHRHVRSLEATWKYIMICSVGIALALLGNFFLAVASTAGAHHHVPMLVKALIKNAAILNVPWLKAAFIFMLVGYGAKMGLAPLHTWLPDAHSESPSVISALLSGALLNCAFLSILRINQVCIAAGLAEFGKSLLIGFGLFSMLVAASFIVKQADFKRMLAYSSVEHMGILSLGIGLSGGGVYAAMLHAVNHSLAKAMLFLVAGNILAVYQSKSAAEIRGVLSVLPMNGILWIAGFLAITGSPPFGLFVSELLILKAALDQGHVGVAVAYLGCLGIIFIGMASIFCRMAQGYPAGLPLHHAQRFSRHTATGKSDPAFHETLLSVLPPVALGALVTLLGVFIPPALQQMLETAAVVVAGR